MAKKPNKPLPVEGLEALPQRFDVWQVDARLAATALPAGERTVRPWLLVVASRTDAQVLGFELFHEETTLAQVWQTLVQTMREPAAGDAHRPTQVHMTKEEWVTALRPSLQSL